MNTKKGKRNRSPSVIEGKILLVDNEADIIDIYPQELRKKGLDVYGFTDPAVALEEFRLNHGEYILVISDIRMPKMNGFEFTRKVKEIDSNAKVFLMTSNFEISDRLLLSLAANSVSMNSMIDEFILKPFSIEQLIMLIRKHMESTIRGY